MTTLDRIQIATGIPDWEPCSEGEPEAFFCVWNDRRWRVERVGGLWEVEIRTGGRRRMFVGESLERALMDAVVDTVFAESSTLAVP